MKQYICQRVGGEETRYQAPTVVILTTETKEQAAIKAATLLIGPTTEVLHVPNSDVYLPKMDNMDLDDEECLSDYATDNFTGIGVVEVVDGVVTVFRTGLED